MIKFYNMKKVLLATAALFAYNVTFAQVTETFEQSSGASAKDVAITGISYTIAGTYSAGGGNGKAEALSAPFVRGLHPFWRRGAFAVAVHL